MITHDPTCELLLTNASHPWTGYTRRGPAACLCHARAWEKDRLRRLEGKTTRTPAPKTPKRCSGA